MLLNSTSVTLVTSVLVRRVVVLLLAISDVGRAMLLNGRAMLGNVTKWQRNRNKSRRSPMLNPLSHWFRIVLFVNPDDEDDRTG